jgi:hypothetical protein
MERKPAPPNASNEKRPASENIKGAISDPEALNRMMSGGVAGVVQVRSARFDSFPQEKTRAPLTAMSQTVTASSVPEGSETGGQGGQSLASARPRNSSSEAVIKRAILGEYIYSTISLILGLAAIIAGSVLCIYGVTGHTSFTASLLGLNTNLNDAAPGVVLFVVGLFMIWITRPKVKLGDLVG